MAALFQHLKNYHRVVGRALSSSGVQKRTRLGKGMETWLLLRTVIALKSTVVIGHILSTRFEILEEQIKARGHVLKLATWLRSCYWSWCQMTLRGGWTGYYLSWLSIAVIKTTQPKTSGEGKGLFGLHVLVALHHWGTKGQNLEAGPEVEVIQESCIPNFPPRLSHPSLLYIPGPNAQGWCHSQWIGSSLLIPN